MTLGIPRGGDHRLLLSVVLPLWLLIPVVIEEEQYKFFRPLIESISSTYTYFLGWEDTRA